MKFKLALMLLPVFVYAACIAQDTLSHRSSVSLLTCDAGEDLYSVFGHSAILIVDSATGYNKVYNYGTFNFDEPGFYTKFVRGQLDYMISASSYDEFMYVYRYYNRSVTGQELNLTLAQRTQLHDFLEHNLLPENKYYKYDFFYDNCATRIRDVIEKVPEANLYFEKHIQGKDSTMREMLDPYVWHMPWIRYGFYLALGTNTEVKAGYYHRMFLPDKLSAAFAKAKILQNGRMVPLVKKTVPLFIGEPIDRSVNGFFRPVVINWLLLMIFLVITTIEVVKEKYFYKADLVLFTILGLFGTFLLLLWVATDHKSTEYNWNLLWAFPLHLLFVPSIRGMNYARVRVIFYSMCIAFCLFILGTWGVHVQKFHQAIVPLIVIIILRSVRIVYRLRHGK